MEHVRLRIDGMTCVNCQNRIGEACAKPRACKASRSATARARRIFPMMQRQ